VISSGRLARSRFAEWAELEPSLDGLRSVSAIVDAIAVPIGASQEHSLSVTQAVLRLASDDPLASRLMVQVMVPIMTKECFRSLRILESQGIRIDDAELVTLVLGSATDAVASLAGSTSMYPLRVLRRRMIKRLVRRRDRLVANSRELMHDHLPEVAASTSVEPPAVLLARTLRLAVGKGIVSQDDAELVWASTHRG